MNDALWRRRVRHLLLAWIALVALMLASLGSAYLPLGAGNAAAGIVIAIVKAAIVAGVFMGLGRAGTAIRIAAAVALGTWLILLSLGGLEQATRPREPARFQGSVQAR